MLKKSPNRAQRTKGIKLKHILQTGLLLGVCFWLIYQVKHSHDKRKERDVRVAEMSIKGQNSNLIRLGRKDLHPRMEEAKNEKLEEEEDDEEEFKSQEEDDKHLTEVQKEEKTKHELHNEVDDEDSKNEDLEDEGRGVGDDEIDERDQENNEGEIDRDEDFIDEEKEREEDENDKDTDEKENVEVEIENRKAEHQDSDDGSNSTHEAREEHYKADDASSEVAHETQTETSDLGKMRSNKLDGDGERSKLVQNDTSINAAVSLKQKESNSDVKEGANSGNDSSFSVKHETHMVSLSSPVSSSVTNLTIKSHLNDQPDTSNRSEQVNAEVVSNSTHILTTGISQLNLTENQSGVLSAEKDVLYNSKTGQAPTFASIEPDLSNNVNASSGSNQSNLNLLISTETKISKATAMDSLNTFVKPTLFEKIIGSNSTSLVEDSNGSTAVKDDADKVLRKMSSNDVDPIRTNENMVSSLSNAIQINSSGYLNSSILDDEKEARIDLRTLPEAKGNNSHEIETE